MQDDRTDDSGIPPVVPFAQKRRSRKKGCDCVSCAYCGDDLTDGRSHEHDHFPLPHRFGGDHVIAACDDCHRMKDRVDFRQWRSDDQWAVLTETMNVTSHPATRVFIAKALAEAMDARHHADELQKRIDDLENTLDVLVRAGVLPAGWRERQEKAKARKQQEAA